MRTLWLAGVLGSLTVTYFVTVPLRERTATALVATDLAQVASAPVKALANLQLGDITGQGPADAVARYDIAERGGNALDMCAHAQKVAVAFLEARDVDNYKRWKERESADCVKAGIPRQ